MLRPKPGAGARRSPGCARDGLAVQGVGEGGGRGGGGGGGGGVGGWGSWGVGDSPRSADPPNFISIKGQKVVESERSGSGGFPRKKICPGVPWQLASPEALKYIKIKTPKISRQDPPGI